VVLASVVAVAAAAEGPSLFRRSGGSAAIGGTPTGGSPRIIPVQAPRIEIAETPAVDLAPTVPAAPISATPAPIVPPPVPPAPPVLAAAPSVPRWQRLAVPAPPSHGRPTITIVVDDMGVMHPNTRIATELPGPLTLAWFPFADRLAEQIDVAMRRGHETVLHMPMQAFTNSIAQTGPDPLRIDLPPAENIARLQTAIAAIPTACGLNNHMGSVATRNVPLMELMAAIAREHEMLFLDSLTINHSVALQQARLAQVPAIARDVFLDDSPNRAAIRAQLALTEKVALRDGRAVAIGHPRKATLEALQEWLPTVAAKGFVLTPLSATVAAENNIAFS
jgi:polysaccharide deacetylase 2 family uncharacterized protein YibQ